MSCPEKEINGVIVDNTTKSMDEIRAENRKVSSFSKEMLKNELPTIKENKLSHVEIQSAKIIGSLSKIPKNLENENTPINRSSKTPKAILSKYSKGNRKFLRPIMGKIKYES